MLEVIGLTGGWGPTTIVERFNLFVAAGETVAIVGRNGVGKTTLLELITGRPPRIIPYLEPDFWKAFPKASAAEFARFVALAKAGHPYMGAMVIEDVAGTKPPEIMTQALREQQRIDLERSLEYAKKKLNCGINWRG